MLFCLTGPPDVAEYALSFKMEPPKEYWLCEDFEKVN